MTVINRRSDKVDGRDRPVEIEITPEMVEAGYEVLADLDWGDTQSQLTASRKLVRSVLRAVFSGRGQVLQFSPEAPEDQKHIPEALKPAPDQS